jgi:cyclophilin family peptidyl-prolyl cis-trans isomerase
MAIATPSARKIGSRAVPSDKRARQRAAREARLAAEAQAKKNRTRLRNGGIVVVVAALIVGIAFLVSGNSPTKPVAGQSAVHGATTTTTLVSEAKTPKGAQAAANLVATKAGCPASTKTQVNTQTYPSAPAMTIDTNKLYSATVVTTAGTFTMALNAKSAPITVNNFVFLADKGYYHCVIFHRVIPGFMDQTGDPTGTGTGLPVGAKSGAIAQPGYTITDENPPKATNPAQQYPLGSVAMANTGSPNSGGSQFFIVAGAQGESLPNTYALFGRVTSGMSVVSAINAQGSAAGVPPDVTQRIISVTINESSGI